jgi:hypothetical protein
MSFWNEEENTTTKNVGKTFKALLSFQRHDMGK